MKKSLPIIIVLIVIVLALVGWFVWGKGKTGTPGGNQQEAQEQTQGESFSGKIKDAFMKNVPLKCTYKMDDNNFGTGWIKNKRYYGEITASGKQGFIILVDNCMWTWNKDEKDKGVKMCFEVEEGKSIWDEMESQDNQFNDDYNCSPSVVNDAVFTPPSDVKFVDLDEMMKGLSQPSQAAGESAAEEE